jgi:hypothetical protein
MAKTEVLAKVELVETDPRDAVGDLLSGAHRRLGSAAWDAKQACERITQTDADALSEIALAQKALDEARRHTLAKRAYQKELNRLVTAK